MSLEPAGGARWHRWRPWLAGAAIAVVGLGVGFGVGRVTGGGGGTRTVTAAPPEPTTTVPRPSRAAARATRGRVRLVILNGTQVTGLAGRTAARARRLGYRTVTVGNGPRISGRSQTWFRVGSRGLAAVAVRDFATAPARRLAPGSPLLSQAPRGQVFVLLGPPPRRLTRAAPRGPRPEGRRGRDLNPRGERSRLRDFQSRSFGRSDTSPERRS